MTDPVLTQKEAKRAWAWNQAWNQVQVVNQFLDTRPYIPTTESLKKSADEFLEYVENGK